MAGRRAGNVTSSCQPVNCSATTVTGIKFALTAGGSIGVGACPVGMFGSVTSQCLQNGNQATWAAINGSCFSESSFFVSIEIILTCSQFVLLSFVSDCQPGTYQDQTGQLLCKSCPINSNSSIGSTSVSQCAVSPATPVSVDNAKVGVLF